MLTSAPPLPPPTLAPCPQPWYTSAPATSPAPAPRHSPPAAAAAAVPSAPTGPAAVCRWGGPLGGLRCTGLAGLGGLRCTGLAGLVAWFGVACALALQGHHSLWAT